ncbi:hypothetical protein OJF2_64320 [Aquisphaera giovannonii]|uniref:Uncharacterized protein n=1 Tax=Aquisphaera giovannonii TaxID=406548 RepID=A0A5B9WD87_9BACT|nr:hypothetical protein [Aquisphaera giovannonii]QEH37840.1 hypothetical protein OJF2_64320 [Aquisphaera giovannonii]
MNLFLLLGGPIGLVLLGSYAWRALRARAMDLWLPSYLCQALRGRGPKPGQSVHLLLCIADHFEPGHGSVSHDVAAGRVRAWIESYPKLFEAFRDSDGRPPRHTFFYPLEMYEGSEVEALATLCHQGYGEVEVHLHHDDEDAEGLRARLAAYKELLAARHGLLARDRDTGDIRYGFIHGNWALDNSHPDGRHCGVDNELDILRETGCYADFTMPAAPDPPQTRTINSIYYAIDDPVSPKSHDRGIAVGAAPAPERSLLMIQGPLLLDWRRRKWGLFPRVENGCLQGNQPAHIDRLPAWLKAGVQVPGRPDWFFVKLHTHGAPECNQRVLLGEAMVRFHRSLADLSRRDSKFHFHYVTAREMCNLVRAAEAGWQGDVAGARDYQLVWKDWRHLCGTPPRRDNAKSLA